MSQAHSFTFDVQTLKELTVLKFQLLPMMLSLAFAVTANTTTAAEFPNPETQIKPGLSTVGGRHQLFQGLVVINNQGTPFNAAAVFKIDSVTGQTWKYEEGKTMDGKPYKNWVPIELIP